MVDISQSENPRSGFNNYTPDIIRGVRNNDFSEVQDALDQNPKCINKQDMYGRTAVMYAAMGKNQIMLEWLSEREGFEKDLIDNEENNILYYAFWSGDKELVNFVFRLLYPNKFSAVIV